jgi:dihydroorotase
VATPDIDPIDLKMKGVFEAMAELGIPLSLHPETTLLTDVHGQITKGFVADAEREFETIAEQIASNHPNLKVIIEHISTKDMADLIGNDKYQNIYGTVTPQHLLYTDHDKQ